MHLLGYKTGKKSSDNLIFLYLQESLLHNLFLKNGKHLIPWNVVKGFF